jgi:hypothetical protein
MTASHSYVSNSVYGPVYRGYDFTTENEYVVIESDQGEVYGTTLKDAIDAYHDIILAGEYGNYLNEQLNYEMMEALNETIQ